MKPIQLLFILMLSSITGFGQFRHVKGVQSIDVYEAKSRYGQLTGANFVKYFSNSTYLKGGFFYEKGMQDEIHFRSIGAEAFFAKTVLHARHYYYLNLMSGVHFSSDQVVSGGSNFNIPTSFKPGLGFGLENEAFISDRFVFIVNFSQRMLLGSEYGKTRRFIEAGIRYNF